MPPRRPKMHRRRPETAQEAPKRRPRRPKRPPRGRPGGPEETKIIALPLGFEGFWHLLLLDSDGETIQDLK
eukprot:3660287-Pyramimonas_sp.AAC.1